jgi:N-acetylglucosamine-6-sulfatase
LTRLITVHRHPFFPSARDVDQAVRRAYHHELSSAAAGDKRRYFGTAGRLSDADIPRARRAQSSRTVGRMRRRLLAVPLTAGLLAGVLGACSIPTSGASVAALRDPSRPSIVFVLTDDLSMNLVSHMPNVQKLKKTGMTMSNYYVVDSLCCPSRAAIFTGKYPHNNGVLTNSGKDGGYDAYNKNGGPQKSFAVAMHDNGYRTGFMGKYFNGYQPTDRKPVGWDEWDVGGNGYSGFNYNLNENDTVHHYGNQPKDYLTDVISNKATSFIRSSTKPFMLELATFAPHHPYAPAPRHKGTAKNVAYPKTPAYDAATTMPPSWLADRPALTPDQKQQLLTNYRKRVAAVQSIDDMVGLLRRTLEDKGIADNTYVVFSSDNGYHMGEHRLLAGKQTAFDTDIHVPLIVAGPHVPAGQTNNQLVSNIDLAPTFETLTGTKVGSRVDGVDMSPLWHGQHPRHWQQGVLIEHRGPNNQAGDPDQQNAGHANPPSYEAVRTADGLYVRYADGEEEYYATNHDPHELHNYGAKGVPCQLREMLSALRDCHGTRTCQTAAGA